MNIFLDLDGCFADFEGYFKDYFGVAHDSVDDSTMWKMINSHEYFFYNLPVMEDALKFYWDLYNHSPLGVGIFFLTACPRSNYQTAALQKRKWVKRHIDQDAHILPVMGGKNKPLFMQNSGDILIDDFEKNIKAWEEHGGEGILHTSFRNSAFELNQLLNREVFDPYKWD